MSNPTIKSFIIFFTFALILTQIECNFKRVCYLRVESNQQIDVHLIESRICTHIILAFTVVTNGTITPPDPDNVPYYKNVTQLKNKFSDLKVMVSIGGGGSDGGFHEVCANQTNIDRFVSSVMQFLLKHDLDGLDIDWEFPSWDTPHPEDKENFNHLLKSLSAEFARQENRVENRRPLILSVAVAAVVNIIDISYDVPEMALYVDFINLMTYDFHDYSPYWPFTGFNAPLFSRKAEKSYFTYLNTNRAVNYWIEKGMSRQKIVVGIPTYSHSYKLASTQHTGVDSAAVAAGPEFTYPEVCELMRNSSTKVYFDDESKVPYLVNGLLWVSYDDPKSVAFKAQWIRDSNLSGAMTFDLNCDDYRNVCDNSTKFVLHSVIYSILS